MAHVSRDVQLHGRGGEEGGREGEDQEGEREGERAGTSLHSGPVGRDDATPSAGEECPAWQSGPLEADAGGGAGPDVHMVAAWGVVCRPTEGDVVSLFRVQYNIPSFG